MLLLLNRKFLEAAIRVLQRIKDDGMIDDDDDKDDDGGCCQLPLRENLPCTRHCVVGYTPQLILPFNFCLV